MKLTYNVFEIGGDDVFAAIHNKINEEKHDENYIKDILKSVSLNTTFIEVEYHNPYKKLFNRFSWDSYIMYKTVNEKTLVLFVDAVFQEPSVMSTTEIVKKMFEDYNKDKERHEKNKAKRVLREKKWLADAEQCVSDIIND